MKNKINIKSDEDRETRTPNLPIWSRMHCHYAMPPSTLVSVHGGLIKSLHPRKIDLDKESVVDSLEEDGIESLIEDLTINTHCFHI